MRMKDGDDGDLDSRRRKETEKPSSVNSRAAPSSTYSIHVSSPLEEGGDFDEELIIGFHPQMAQHTSYRVRPGFALQTTFRFF